MKFEKPPVSTVVNITIDEEDILLKAYGFIYELIDFMDNNDYDIVYGNHYGDDYEICKIDELKSAKEILYALKEIDRLE